MKRIVRDITPPAVWRSVGGLKQKARRRATPPGTELGADFYDRNMERAARYKAPYQESPVYPLWAVIADRIVLGGQRSVLEVGCGTGQFATHLSERGGVAYCGFDFSPKRIEWARESNPALQFEVDDAHTSALLDNLAYDAVVSTEFLEHIEGDLEVLERVRPRVRVLATVPNYPGTGHVRHFETAGEVTKRYGGLLRGLTVTSFQGPRNAVHYLLDGTT